MSPLLPLPCISYLFPQSVEHFVEHRPPLLSLGFPDLHSKPAGAAFHRDGNVLLHKAFLHLPQFVFPPGLVTLRLHQEVSPLEVAQFQTTLDHQLSGEGQMVEEIGPLK